jgi:hypothetical protein
MIAAPRAHAPSYLVAGHIFAMHKPEPAAEEANHMKLRTLIMVASMIVLPLAAVLGVKWPHFIEASRSTDRSALDGASASAARNNPRETAAAAGKRNAASQVRQASEAAAGGSVINAHIANTPNYQNGVPTNYDVQQAGAEVSLEDAPLGEGSEPQALPIDPYTEIQNRLRAMGATYYALETWGPHADGFRFQCRMAAGQGPNYLRYFEATDADPIGAMRSVLDEVEAWKAGRLP